MQNKKQNNQKVFGNKKFHQKIEKSNRKESKESLSRFSELDFEALHDFMENKYDNMIAKNLEQEIDINKAVINQIKTLTTSLLAESKKQFVKFMRQECQDTVGVMKDQEIIKIGQEVKSKGNKYILTKLHKGFISRKVQTNLTTDRMKEKQFIWDLDEECLREIDIKRIKKDSIQLLDSLVRVVKKQKEFL